MADPRVTKFISYYRALGRRDRLALNALGIFIAILVLYFGLWSSLTQYYEDSKDYRDRQLELLQYMQRTEQQARDVAAARSSTGTGGQTLLTRISRTAQQAGIKPNRLQPEGSGSVSVWFNNVAFNDLAQWLDKVVGQQNVSIKQISIDREGQPGKVNARLVLGD
ncbi:MAG: type II secretion system protein M [Pseudomonadales bacterium]